MTGEDGHRHYVARTIRNISNAEIVRQLQSIIEEYGYKSPSRSQLFEILTWLPAARSKELSGIDTTLEKERKVILL